MTITRVTDGNTSAATNLNQLIDLMEGAESIDFLLKSLTATDFKVRLADAAAARKFIIQDSAGNTVAYIDSDGNASFTSVALSALVAPTSASPSQTAEGSLVWDSNDDYLTVGDGSSRKSFQPAGQGSDLTAAATITPTHNYHRVTGSTGISAISVMPAGFQLKLTFASTPQITHGTALKLAGAANYTVTAEETLEFECDGTNWREVGRKPVAAATSGLTYVGGDTTEYTTSSTTSTTMATIVSLSIATGVPFEIHFSYRKSTGAAAEGAFGLALNGTIVHAASYSGSSSHTTAANLAETGYAIIRVGPREANYLRSVMIQCVTDGMGTNTIQTLAESADMPTATITNLAIKGIVSSASITLGIKNVRVYTLATS